MSQSNSSSRQKTSRSAIGPANPELSSTNLVDLKRKKSQQTQLKNLKSTIQKELKLLIKKDENILKRYMKKQEQLKYEITKHQRSIENKNYKQWLQFKKQQQLQQKKISTLKLKTTIKEHVHQAISKNLTSKKSIADQTKKTINDWKLQKHLSHQNLFAHNQKIIEKIGQSRSKTRQSNTKFFEKRHSQNVKTKQHEVQLLQRQSLIEKRIVSKLQNDILSIKEKSQNKLRIIEQLEIDIMNTKNQSLILSTSRSRISTPKKLFLKKQHSEKLESDGRVLSNKDDESKFLQTVSSMKRIGQNQN